MKAFATYILLAAAMAVSSVASAGVLLVAQNNAGGQIMLTDQPCPSSKGQVVLSNTRSGGLASGCWLYIAHVEKVLVQWSDGTESLFNEELFSITSYGAQVVRTNAKAKAWKSL